MTALLRDQPHVDAHRTSVERRMGAVRMEPRTLPHLVAWLRTEWAREAPERLHEPGTEPSDLLGSPRLAGPFRTYIMGHPMATDHDNRLDVDCRGAARLRPIHAALWQMKRKWPLSARFIFGLAWTGADWRDMAHAWNMEDEVGQRFAHHALLQLWQIWARDQATASPEVA